eukprot:g3763.t1
MTCRRSLSLLLLAVVALAATADEVTVTDDTTTTATATTEAATEAAPVADPPATEDKKDSLVEEAENKTKAFYPEGSGVESLTWGNWQQVVRDEDNGWFVEVYAPWCAACKAMKDDFSAVARSLSGIIKVGAVNADEQYKLNVLYKGDGYPALWFFPPGARRKPVEYRYKRDVEGLITFSMGMLPNYIIQIRTLAEWNAFNQIEEGEWPRAALFTLNPAKPVTFRALAYSMRRKMLFGQVIHSRETAHIFQAFQVPKVPALYLQASGDQSYMPYKEDLDYHALMDFFGIYADEVRLDAASHKDVQKWYQDKLYQRSPDVKTLTTKTFHKKVSKHEGNTLVFFYHSWSQPCDMVLNEIDALPAMLKDEKIQVAQVNGDREIALFEKYNVSSIPTIALFEGDGTRLRTLATFPGEEPHTRQRSVLAAWARDPTNFTLPERPGAPKPTKKEEEEEKQEEKKEEEAPKEEL